MKKIRTLLICPGRGSYTKRESGYLKLNKKYNQDIIDWMDKQRVGKGLKQLKELDLMPFKSSIHMSGENASPLIYACSISDFYSLSKKNFDFVCVIGNSMGWYTALAISGAISINNSYKIVQSMGSIMDSKGVGGQLIYPIIDDNWQIDEDFTKYITSQIKKTKNFVSIKLGGYVVVGGEKKSIDRLSNILPKKGVFPQIIPYHAAFHTPLLKKISNKIKKKYKNIDILINAAGHIHNELFVNYKNEFKYHKSTTWKKTINSNLNSVFFSTKNFLPLLMESNNSDKLIINFSSVNSDGIVGQAAYSASKKAVEILTKVWAKEFAPFKIRVACISPGYINTESTLKNTKEKSRKKILEEIPSKRFGEINEILNSLNFILNNRYFNGKILKIDGGL